MRVSTKLISLLLILICANLAVHAQFAGSWRTPVVPATGKPIYTINIIGGGKRISGTLIQVLPNGTRLEHPIIGPEVNEMTLRFNTATDQGTTFHWLLTVKDNRRKGILHGTEGPFPTGERSGELVIEMPVKNYKHP